MNPATQTKLLRVLQERKVQRVGGKEDIAIDVRVVAATHRDLEAAIRAGTFREDLYYRLAGVVIRLPPLRERGGEDVARLVKFFLGRFGKELGQPAPAIEPAAIAVLQEHAWPGNVRQLANVIRQALLGASGFPVTTEHVNLALHPRALVAAKNDSFEREVEVWLNEAAAGKVMDIHAVIIDAAERIVYRRAFELSGGNQAMTARWLGVARQTVRDQWQRLGLRPGDATP